MRQVLDGTGAQETVISPSKASKRSTSRNRRREARTKWDSREIPDQSGKIAIVTGANTGIGFSTASELAAKGSGVVLACRNEAKGKRALRELRAANPDAELELMMLDLASLRSVEAFADSFSSRYQSLDLLVNNAGVMVPPYGLTEDGFETQFGINHLGHFALTGHLLPLLSETAKSRVVTVSSAGHRTGRINFEDLQRQRRYIPFLAYSQSKLANLLFTYELQRRLDRRGLEAIALAAHPGGSSTDLGRHNRLLGLILGRLLQPSEMGALPILRAATDPWAKGGEYFGPRSFLRTTGYPEPERPSRRSRDAVAAERLWRVSEELTGVRYLSN